MCMLRTPWSDLCRKREALVNAEKWFRQLEFPLIGKSSWDGPKQGWVVYVSCKQGNTNYYMMCITISFIAASQASTEGKSCSKKTRSLVSIPQSNQSGTCLSCQEDSVSRWICLAINPSWRSHCYHVLLRGMAVCLGASLYNSSRSELRRWWSHPLLV